MGAADLIANGKQVAVIDYHSGDVYQTTASAARLSYYGLTGTPTAWFDGGSAVVGGNHTNSMYSQYLAKYNQKIAIQSSFTIDIAGSNSGMIDYELNITLNKVASTTATNMVMHLVVTESDIAQNWQGMTELNHVERLMIPNQNGTPLDFTSSNTVEVTKNFSMDPNWVTENCEVIVFIQNLTNKEILQAESASLSDFATTNNYDASVLQVVAPLSVCLENFTPKVKIANYGLDNLTSLDIVMQMNEEPSIVYNWTGDLAFLESELVELSPVNFTILEANTFSVSAENPNGQPDQFPSNDAKVMAITDAPNVSSPVNLALKLDENPGETTWTLLNSDGIGLYSGGPYAQANQFIVQSFVLPETDCYTFIIYDSGGDGLLGQGMYKLAYQGSTIFAEGKDFGNEEQVQFAIGLSGMDELIMDESFSITPNPMKDNAVVSFQLKQKCTAQLKVYNAVGEMVFETKQIKYDTGIQAFTFENDNLNAGIYFFQLNAGSETLTRKVVVNE